LIARSVCKSGRSVAVSHRSEVKAMIEGTLNTHADEEKQSFTMRDFLAIGFRQRRLIINTFLGIVAVSAVIAFLLPKKYEAQMKILVRHERPESVVSPEREAPVQWRTEVSEEELQSEADQFRFRLQFFLSHFRSPLHGGFALRRHHRLRTLVSDQNLHLGFVFLW